MENLLRICVFIFLTIGCYGQNFLINNMNCLCQISSAYGSISCTKQSSDPSPFLNIGDIKRFFQSLRIDLKVNNKLFTSILPFTFSGLSFLFLDLSSNQIKSISDQAFMNITKLYDLNLSQNKLSSINNLLFSFSFLNGNQLSEFTDLNLSKNRIKILSVIIKKRRRLEERIA
jgi:Leucine-rich repeat (LRR) protein